MNSPVTSDVKLMRLQWMLEVIVRREGRGLSKDGRGVMECVRLEKEVKNGETRAAVKDGGSDVRAVLSIPVDSCDDEL